MWICECVWGVVERVLRLRRMRVSWRQLLFLGCALLHEGVDRGREQGIDGDGLFGCECTELRVERLGESDGGDDARFVVDAGASHGAKLLGWCDKKGDSARVNWVTGQSEHMF